MEVNMRGMQCALVLAWIVGMHALSNAAPQADAGPDQTVNERNIIYLTGSGCAGQALTCAWRQIDGIEVELSNEAIVNPSFKAPWVVQQRVLTFELSVTDVNTVSDSDTISITVQGEPDYDDYIDTIINLGGTDTMPYRLFIPRFYNPAQQWPLVLYLHGAGARGQNNLKQLQQSGGMHWIQPAVQNAHPHFVIAPHSPSNGFWANVCNRWPNTLPDPPNGPGSCWSNGSNWQVDTTREMELVRHILDSTLARFSIDENRLYVAGRSMGGMGTWDIITRQHDRFAAAIPAAGGGDPDRAPFITDMAVWAHHGSADGTVPPRGSRNLVNAVFAAGGWPTYTEYAGKGHGWVCDNTWDQPGLYDWLFSHRKGDATPPTAPTLLSVTASGQTGFDLAWTSAADPETGIKAYDIFRDGVRIDTTIASLVYSDQGLDFNTSYTYEIRAVNKSLRISSKSNAITRSTFSAADVAFQQSSGSDGLVSIEVEHYYAKAGGSGHDWEPDATTGYSGDGAMISNPDNGLNINTNYAANSPHMYYYVNFVKTGTHYIWLRGIGDSNTGGVSNSCHVGIDGAQIAGSDRISGFEESWSWIDTTMDAYLATVTVQSTGIKRVYVYMREDGLILDKLVVTTTPDFGPTGAGPVESPRMSPPDKGTLTLQGLDSEADAYLYAASGWYGDHMLDGNGTIAGLSAGNYRLCIRQPGRRDEFLPATVAAGKNTLITVTMKNPVALSFVQPDTITADGAPLNAGVYSTSVCGDVDNDGDGDLLCARRDGAVDIYISGGSEFAFAATINLGLTGVHCIRLVDWNGDNVSDILTAQINGDIRLSPGNGSGNFSASTLVHGASLAVTGFDVCDLNNDHQPDFVFGLAGGALVKAVNNGAGWDHAYIHIAGGGGVDAGDSAAPCLLDVTGDGISDIITGRHSGTLDLYEMTSAGELINLGPLNVFGQALTSSQRICLASMYNQPGELPSLVISGSEGYVHLSDAVLRGDFAQDSSHIVDANDLAVMGDAFGSTEDQPAWEPVYNLDLTRKGGKHLIDAMDISAFGDSYGITK
ncbi:MAG: hypothetical protein GF398_08770 [Chitinivibrionales bacterium]|nr:hypothetical protein [Chitinivibrionales bacterium]